jgi:tRNA(adenine34) deaminase
MTDEYFMGEAVKEAELALEKKEVPVGAIIVLDNKIIGRGHNRIESLNDPTAHAEIIAITSAANTLNNWRLNDAIIYVTVEPCPMCAGAIMLARISKCVFGIADPRAGGLVSSYKIKTPKLEVIPGVLEPMCKSLMEEFFKKLRNKNTKIAG